MIHGSIVFLALLFTGFLVLTFNTWDVVAGCVRVEVELKRQLPDLVVSSGAGGEELPDEILLPLAKQTWRAALDLFSNNPTLNQVP